ncbi:carboxymuconolactone decarboxylase family protein [[Haemophilus] felis]|uniref:Alkylhydroperoxidase n=1 Tax=[Haemophilus] felis TaxID=123822 RepID=A0A1T0BAB4_9PAST|nr:carboxymuconolactone decarboxylase family protein [[Haemophilus] felis]OOS07173.1 alkylhydroperoxidase [[Haemophilus] felis]
MTIFTIHTLNSAPEETKDILVAVQNANGFIPNLIGVLANAPTALETYRTVGGINDRNSLTAEEREIVQITAAVVNGCGFCVAGHTKIALKRLKMDEQIVRDIRATARIGENSKLDSLARFTLTVMLQKAKLTHEQLNAFFSAGYNQQNALDVILGVSLATLCNYANNIANTPINSELQDFA